LIAIFSKFTIGIYTAIALIVFVLTNRQTFTIGQIISIGFSIIIVCFPVMISVSFPLLIVGRWFTASRSDAEVQASDSWIHTEAQRLEWLEAWFLWSRKSLSIRNMRVFWISFQFLVLLIALSAVLQFTSPPSIPNAPPHLPRRSIDNSTIPVRLLNPICYINLAGFDMVQMSAFAESSYATREDLDLMFDAFFGANRSATIEELPTNITDRWGHSNIRHFRTNVTNALRTSWRWRSAGPGSRQSRRCTAGRTRTSRTRSSTSSPIWTRSRVLIVRPARRS
jgi:hypothetical protein